MSRQQKDPLRPLRDTERVSLVRLSRSASAPAAQVARARALLAVAEGLSYTAAAHLVGRHTGDPVTRWVAGFNDGGLAAVVPRHGGGHPVRYGAVEQRRILAAVARPPDRARDGTASWSLNTPTGSSASGRGWSARRQHLHDWPYPTRGRFQLAEESDLVRDWRGGAQASARRLGQRHRSGCRRKKGLIERAYTQGAGLGFAVWCEDEPAPFQAVPHPGSSGRPHGQPATQPHEYVRGGTTKILTLFHPATGQVYLHPATSCTNSVLHGWLKTELTAILARLPIPNEPVDAAETQAAWQVWQDGLTTPFTLPKRLPPLRLLLVWDNLAGHKSTEMVLWLCQHGIMPNFRTLAAATAAKSQNSAILLDSYRIVV